MKHELAFLVIVAISVGIPVALSANLPSVEATRERVKAIIKYTALTDTSDDPFFVISIDRIYQQFQQWRQLLPRFRPYYAMRTNPLPAIVELLAALGAGFDCSTKHEIEQILSIGVPARDIIYGQTVKREDYLRYAVTVDVQRTTFDAVTELYKIAKLHPSAQLLLRIKINDTGVAMSLGKKYGCYLSEAGPLLQQAAQLKLNVVGVAFHVGGNVTDANVYTDAIRVSRTIFDVAEGLGFRMKVLNIGGGFPSGQVNPMIFANEAYAINAATDQYFPSSDPRFTDLELVGEPGRIFVGDTPLVVKVIGERYDPDTNAHFVYLNDGYHQSLHGIVGWNLPIIPEVMEIHPRPKRPAYNTTLWGPTCDSNDKIKENFMFEDVSVDDILVLQDMGAYTDSLGSTFNGFPLPFHVYHLSPELKRELSQMPRWDRVVSAMTKNL